MAKVPTDQPELIPGTDPVADPAAVTPNPSLPGGVDHAVAGNGHSQRRLRHDTFKRSSGRRDHPKGVAILGDGLCHPGPDQRDREFQWDTGHRAASQRSYGRAVLVL